MTVFSVLRFLVLFQVGLVLALLLPGAHPTPLRPTPVPAALVPPDSSRLRAVVDSFAQNGQFEGGTVLVAQEDEILLANGWGLANRETGRKNTPHTRFRLGSLTKSFTAVLTLQLVQEEQIALSDPIGRHVSDLPGRVGNRVTIQHLLTHTSGLPEFYRLDDFDRSWLRNPPPLDELMRWVAEHSLEFEPGAIYDYRNSNFLMLGLLIEHVTGDAYESVLTRRVLEPAGMSSSGVEQAGESISHRAWGYARSDGGWQRGDGVSMDLLHAAGGMYSTANDLWRFSQALDSTLLLDRKLRQLMFAPQVPEDPDTGSARSYALGWHVDELSLTPGRPPIMIVEHGGDVTSFETLLTRVPALDAVIVILFNHGETDQDALRNALIRVLLRQRKGS